MSLKKVVAIQHLPEQIREFSTVFLKEHFSYRIVHTGRQLSGNSRPISCLQGAASMTSGHFDRLFAACVLNSSSYSVIAASAPLQPAQFAYALKALSNGYFTLSISFYFDKQKLRSYRKNGIQWQPGLTQG